MNVLREAEGGLMMFHCPGCGHHHAIRVSEGPHSCWTWNADMIKPTFSPSILVTGKDFTPKGWEDYEAWCESGYPALNGREFDSAPTVCHSFVTDGRIQFLGDCTHALAGQTVDLPAWDEHDR